MNTLCEKHHACFVFICANPHCSDRFLCSECLEDSHIKCDRKHFLPLSKLNRINNEDTAKVLANWPAETSKIDSLINSLTQTERLKTDFAIEEFSSEMLALSKKTIENIIQVMSGEFRLQNHVSTIIEDYQNAFDVTLLSKYVQAFLQQEENKEEISKKIDNYFQKAEASKNTFIDKAEELLSKDTKNQLFEMIKKVWTGFSIEGGALVSKYIEKCFPNEEKTKINNLLFNSFSLQSLIENENLRREEYFAQMKNILSDSLKTSMENCLNHYEDLKKSRQQLNSCNYSDILMKKTHNNNNNNWRWDIEKCSPLLIFSYDMLGIRRPAGDSHVAVYGDTQFTSGIYSFVIEINEQRGDWIQFGLINLPDLNILNVGLLYQEKIFFIE